PPNGTWRQPLIIKRGRRRVLCALRPALDCPDPRAAREEAPLPRPGPSIPKDRIVVLRHQHVDTPGVANLVDVQGLGGGWVVEQRNQLLLHLLAIARVAAHRRPTGPVK